VPEDTIVSVEGVSHHFGGLVALDNCSWTLRRGLIAALIGPNGAGKTTLVNLVAGAYPLQRGRVRLDGTDVSGWPPHRIAQQGLIRTFQIARDFQNLTVFENMLVAPRHQPGENVWNALFRPGLGRAAERRDLARAAELLNMFDIYPLRNEYASALSGGQQRLLELARAMMSEPKLLMLDEPMSAISPVLVERISRHLQDMRASGMTILLVEHNLAVVDQICDWVSVMVGGSVLASGSMVELRKHPDVISAYLGREVVERTTG
jgi:ABC-type branched-subunit amino acid transport system ATPase component